MELERTALPGMGVSYTFATAEGQRVGVVAHLSGRRDLISYDSEDRERVLHTAVLTDTEARTVAQLLGLPVFVDQVAELAGGLDGVEAVRIPITAGSPYWGRSIADTRARSRTGASIVAVIRDGTAIPSPTPDFEFRSGDAVVAVGDDAATGALREVLING
ncbi:cation:proton antiporter regulatory subunit [Actinoplanes sp. GCM10030250]|uniref:cation:proton antiporter regulatory subunit n=1 Tax=Actinoplanes sp. GCM10030250 TaxID=3273376 RepID=UPI0036165EC9